MEKDHPNLWITPKNKTMKRIHKLINLTTKVFKINPYTILKFNSSPLLKWWLEEWSFPVVVPRTKVQILSWYHLDIKLPLVMIGLVWLVMQDELRKFVHVVEMWVSWVQIVWAFRGDILDTWLCRFERTLKTETCFWEGISIAFVTSSTLVLKFGQEITPMK